MDWILTLSLGTFVLLIGFLLWNRISTKRHQKHGAAAEGIGGQSDPLAGNTPGIRSGDEIRKDLDTAAASEEAPTLHEKNSINVAVSALRSTLAAPVWSSTSSEIQSGYRRAARMPLIL